MVPKNYHDKTAISKVSNAVSHVSARSLDIFWHPYKNWKIFHNFKRKCDIFKNSVEYQKITSTARYVSFDVGWLYPCLIRCWKAQNLYFSKNYFGYHLGFHIWLCSYLRTLRWYIFYSKIEMTLVILRIIIERGYFKTSHRGGCFENFYVCASISINIGPNFTSWHANVFSALKRI